MDLVNPDSVRRIRCLASTLFSPDHRRGQVVPIHFDRRPIRSTHVRDSAVATFCDAKRFWVPRGADAGGSQLGRAKRRKPPWNFLMGVSTAVRMTV